VDIEELVSITLIPGEKYVSTMHCRACGELVYDVSTIQNGGDLEGACAAVALHMEIRHGIAIKFEVCGKDCQDPSHPGV